MKISKMFFLFFTIIVCNSLYALEHQPVLEKELEQCLSVNWGIDPHTTAFIVNKFKPLIQNKRNHAVIKDFITLSKKQNITFPVDKKIASIHPEDGLIKAPKEHFVIFESPYARVLFGSTASGARENFHEHPWKSIMVILIPTTYKIEYPNGKEEITDYPIGAFELPPGERYACTNLGKIADASLRFEIKD